MSRNEFLCLQTGLSYEKLGVIISQQILILQIIVLSHCQEYSAEAVISME
jgi:hypothetical protein